MGLWTDIRDFGESALSTATPFDIRSESARKKTTGATGALNRVRNYEEGTVNKILNRTPEAEKRAQQYAVNDQIKAYKEATEISRQQLEETKAQRDVEKRRVQEKQIRSLRGQYRPAGGFLDNQQSSSLGNESSLPNKLGS